MKKLLLILLLFPTLTFSQQSDSSLIKNHESEIAQIKMSQEFMRDNLLKAHNEYNTGTALIGTGIGMSFVGLCVVQFVDVKGADDYSNYLFTTGSLLGLIGWIIQIDSHKHIGKAGRWKYEGDKITFSLN